jgi:hypothetical protein
LQRAPWHVWILPALLPLLVWLAIRVLRAAPDALGSRRALVLISTLTYLIAVVGYWPLPTQQDVLPFIPLLMVFVAGAVTGMAQRGRPGWSRALTWLLLGVEMAVLLSSETPGIDGESAYTHTLATVLALTSPTDTVMDCKGESVFRMRPTRLVLESVTRWRMQLGWLPDDIPEHLRQTHVVIRDCGELPPRTRSFLDRNYLAIGNLVAVAGTRLAALPASTVVAFNLGVAASYVAITNHGVFQGSIDGLAYVGPRTLAPGRHTLVSTRAEPGLELIWSHALARGFRTTPQPAIQ